MRPAFTVPVFGFPVEVSWSAIFVLAFVVFANAGDGASTEALGQGLLLGAVIFGSILVHELGHAFAGEALGLRTLGIVLHGFGGLCQYGRAPTPGRGFLAALAGPAAGLLLGLAALVASLVLPAGLPPGVALLLRWLVAINLFWSAFNLLPMIPLDGGMMLYHALRAWLGPLRARPVVRWTSIAVAVPVGVLGLAWGYVFIPIVALLVILQNLRS